MTDRILFLDIDGVLLSGRAWMLPQNRMLRAKATGLPSLQASELIGREAVFDTSAVALVARICEAAEARVVVCSSWRYTVGLDRTRDKVLEQGLPEAFLHPDWACAVSGDSPPDKGADVRGWLHAHAVAGQGSWLVLDDEEIVSGATLRTDPLEGLGVRDAAAAVRYFGSTDVALGVMPVPEVDVDRVGRAFGGDWVEACCWLEGSSRRDSWRTRPSALLTRGDREGVRRRLETACSLSVERWW